jgi:hypothetical protein
VLPSTATRQAPILEITAPTSAAVEAVPSASPNKIKYDDGEEDVPKYSFGLRASPYLSPYAYDSDSLDKQYGIRHDRNSTVTIDGDSNIYNKDKHFKGTEGIWEL